MMDYGTCYCGKTGARARGKLYHYWDRKMESLNTCEAYMFDCGACGISWESYQSFGGYLFEPNGKAHWLSIEMTDAERLFYLSQNVPDGRVLVPQWGVLYAPMRMYFVDFVLWNSALKKVEVAFEIDGNTHASKAVSDALRDSRIKDILGCTVVRIDAADVYKNAKRLAIA